MVACSSQSSADKNWEKIEKRGSIKVGKCLKLKIDFTEMGVDGMLTSVNSGQVGIANYSLEDENNNIKKFLRSEPYKYSFTSMAVRESDNPGISLHGKTSKVRKQRVLQVLNT